MAERRAVEKPQPGRKTRGRGTATRDRMMTHAVEQTPEEVAELRRQKYNATVVYLRKAHNDLMMMRIQPDTPRPPHKPGQYAALGLGYWEPRFPGCQEEQLLPGDEKR